LLADVCQDLYEEEELMLQMVASIIDIEQKSSDLKKRRGVVSKIENQIKKSFYKDEIDACNFAMEKLQRKKNMGASYDPKAEAEDIQLDLWEIEEEIYENQ
jgi:DNA sulfur modification protein DndC